MIFFYIGLSSSIFFLLLSVIVYLIGYIKYIQSDYEEKYSQWRIFHYVISDLNYNDFISISLLCIVPLLREILIVLVLIFYTKEIIKKPFISIYLTNKRLEKLNKQMQDAIANGNSPTEKQITLAEKLNRRKKNLTQ